MQTSTELLEKIQICNQQIAIQARKETIKRGRRLEKKGKYAEALEQFEQAAAQQTEDWLEKKIAELRNKQMLSETSSVITAAESSDDPEVGLAAYEKALTLSPDDSALVRKKAEYLVRLGRFDEAITEYATHPPDSDSSRYYCGYAYAKTEHYLKALEQWVAIADKNAKLSAQIEVLLPFVARDLDADKQKYGIAYALLHELPEAIKSARLKDYEHRFKFQAIEQLWSRQAYPEILEILSPHPQRLSLPLLELYAKLYFKLAESDIQYLQTAISFWLTAIYNESLLDKLALKQHMGDAFDSLRIRKRLLQCLQDVLAKYAREGSLPKKLRTFQEVEARVIHYLAGLTPCSLEIFPCTPWLAAEFSLSTPIFEFLQANRKSDDQTEAFFEASAYFSEAGQSLILLELGEEDKALASVSKNHRDELSEYCHWRVSLGYGMAKLRQGEQRLKRYFINALPLLKRYPHYADELANLAYAEQENTSYAGLAEVMEPLSAHIETPKFREATAHAMGLKAEQLLGDHVRLEVVEKLLKKALTIFPDAEQAKTLLAEVKVLAGLRDISLAFKRQNLAKAVNIVNQSRHPEHISYFFKTMEGWFETVMTWERKLKLRDLRDFYHTCSQVDDTHPLTLKIGAELRSMEQ